MATLTLPEIRNSLKRKGFIARHNDHEFFQYTVDGHAWPVRTKLSHGREPIGDYLIAQMSRELYLKKDQFLALINCTLSQEEYHQILLEKIKIKNTED